MNERKEFLRELYLNLDRWLQNNCKLLLFGFLAVWITWASFRPQRVDFEAISGRLD